MRTIQSFCKRGHPLKGDNVSKGKYRYCVKCKQMRNARQASKESFLIDKEEVPSVDEFAKEFFKLYKHMGKLNGSNTR